MDGIDLLVEKDLMNTKEKELVVPKKEIYPGIKISKIVFRKKL